MNVTTDDVDFVVTFFSNPWEKDTNSNALNRSG